MDLLHLRPEGRELVALPAEDRLALMPPHQWIGYTRAAQALTQMKALFAREPGRVRPRCLLIVGPTNNGKTAIAQRFLRQHAQRTSDDGEHEVFPAVMVQMPPSPTANRIYATILAAIGMPVIPRGRVTDLEAVTLDLLRRVGCRMLVLDEVHNLLAAPTQHQRGLLNLLRYLTNELRIPLVGLGTREGWLAVRSDDQLENRFEPFLLSPWEDSPELGRLLASFEAVLPLREPSGLGAQVMRTHVLRRSEGTIGEIAALLLAATEAAFRAGRERITPEDLDAADYQPPTIRRRLFEQEIR